MSYQEVESNVIAVLAEKKGLASDKIRLDSRLEQDLGLDSFDSIEMVFGLEEKFHIKIPDQDIAQVKTVKDVVDYIAHKESAG